MYFIIQNLPLYMLFSTLAKWQWKTDNLYIEFQYNIEVWSFGAPTIKKFLSRKLTELNAEIREMPHSSQSTSNIIIVLAWNKLTWCLMNRPKHFRILFGCSCRYSNVKETPWNVDVMEPCLLSPDTVRIEFKNERKKLVTLSYSL